MRAQSRLWHAPLWLFTAIMIASGIADVAGMRFNVATFIHLGYPPYLLRVLGIAKLSGAAALLSRSFPRVREWALAGFTFDLLGALIAHAVAGDRGPLALPVSLLILLGIAIGAERRSGNSGSVSSPTPAVATPARGR